MWLQSSSINTLTWPLNLRLLLFPAGTSAALSASSPCCHGDESWHKRQAGRHDVSQDLHPKARQRQVTIRGWSVTGRSWSGIFRALLPVWLSTQRASEYTVTNNAFSQQSPQKQCMFAPWGPIHISLVFNVFMFVSDSILVIETGLWKPSNAAINLLIISKQSELTKLATCRLSAVDYWLLWNHNTFLWWTDWTKVSQHNWEHRLARSELIIVVSQPVSEPTTSAVHAQ